tara:strand:- start:1259 stop:1435 length:177 start_codon:yes stop_codon:yes gene_type:complete
MLVSTYFDFKFTLIFLEMKNKIGFENKHLFMKLLNIQKVGSTRRSVSRGGGSGSSLEK